MGRKSHSHSSDRHKNWLLNRPLAARHKSFISEPLEGRVLLSSAIAAFGMPQTIATGPYPATVAAADVNGDGKADLVVADPSTSSVSVLLGNGDGTFQPQQTFAASGRWLAVSDVNGDGKPDLIVAGNGGIASDVCLLLGNGDGTFQAPQVLSSFPLASALAVADVNGDGIPDVLFGTSRSGTVNILVGNGDGTFQNQRTFLSGLEVNSIAVVDLNGDGKSDLAVANSVDGNVCVLLGNGDGTFQPRLTFAAGAYPYSLAVADLNNDGKPDLIVANNSSSSANNVSVLLGNGNGTFQSQQTYASGEDTDFISVADLNRDGKKDLLFTNQSGNTVNVMLGNGDGTFHPPQNFAAGSNARSIAISDVNGDGRPDVVVANTNNPGTVSVLLGDVPPTVLSINRSWPPGPYTSDSTVSYTVTFNESVTGVDPTDFTLALNGPTATTPVSVTPVSGSIYTVTINGISGTGTLGLNLVDDGSIQDVAGNPLQPGGMPFFMPQQTFTSGASSTGFAVADVNGDGKPDLIVGNTSIYPATARVMLGNGDGSFRLGQTFTALNAIALIVADVNGDGKLDLLTPNAVLLGNGNGTFQAERTFAGNNSHSLAVADLNGDGRPDLVVADEGQPNNNVPGDVSILLGNGNGTFRPQPTFAAGAGPWSVTTADLNHDGRVDLVCVNEISRNLSVFLGNGNGTFQSQRTLAVLGPTGYGTIVVAVSDVNGDGRPDLIVANNTSASVLLGSGDGTFHAQQTFFTGINADSLVVTDLNGDGRPDIIVTNEYSSSINAVAVLLGNGDGTFQPRVTFATGKFPVAAVADVNGDGRPDVVTANAAYGGSVSVLLASSNGNAVGQVYTIVPVLDTVNFSGGSPPSDLSLSQDPDGQHVDWILGFRGQGVIAQTAMTDPNGLTINGDGSHDFITLDYSNGIPLPNSVHLNGVFTIFGPADSAQALQGTDPLANTTLDIGRSTVYFSYSSSDPLALIQGYLRAGYNNGGWNGTPTGSTGVITSIPAAQNAVQTTAVGYADSADGLIAGQPANTIELKYTLFGDTTLTGSVGFNDFTRLTQHYNQTTGGTWDTGDFNYDGSVNSADFTLMTRTYNTSLGSQAQPAVDAASSSSSTASTSSAPTAAAKSLKLVPISQKKHRH